MRLLLQELNDDRRINHIAIVVPDLDAAVKSWESRLGADVSAPQKLPEHGVTVVFIDTGNSKVELLEPLGDDSPIARYLERNPDGGMHHMCFEVDDIIAARDQLIAEGARVLGDGEPRQARMANLFCFFIRKISTVR